jgi:hypothetical protein
MAEVREDLPNGFILCTLVMILGCVVLIRIKAHEDLIQSTIESIENKQYILHEEDFNLIENY